MIKFYYHGDYSYMISHIIPLLSSFLVIFGGWNLHFFSAKFRSDLRHSEPNAQTTGPGGPWDIGIGLVSDIVEWSFWIGKPKRWNRSNSDQHMVASPWNRFGYPEISWGWRFAKMVVPQTMVFFIAPFHVSPCFTSIWVKNGYPGHRHRHGMPQLFEAIVLPGLWFLPEDFRTALVLTVDVCICWIVLVLLIQYHTDLLMYYLLVSISILVLYMYSHLCPRIIQESNGICSILLFARIPLWNTQKRLLCKCQNVGPRPESRPSTWGIGKFLLQKICGTQHQKIQTNHKIHWTTENIHFKGS